MLLLTQHVQSNLQPIIVIGLLLGTLYPDHWPHRFLNHPLHNLPAE